MSCFCLFVCLSYYLSVCLSFIRAEAVAEDCLSVCLSGCLYYYLSVCLSNIKAEDCSSALFVCQSFWLSVLPSICLPQPFRAEDCSWGLFICLSVFLAVCLTICLSASTLLGLRTVNTLCYPSWTEVRAFSSDWFLIVFSSEWLSNFYVWLFFICRHAAVVLNAGVVELLFTMLRYKSTEERIANWNIDRVIKGHVFKLFVLFYISLILFIVI